MYEMYKEINVIKRILGSIFDIIVKLVFERSSLVS